MSTEQPGEHVSLGHRIQYLLVTLFRGVLRILPRSVAMGLARFLGRIGYYLLPLRRRVMLENLSIAFPDMKHADRKRIAVQCSQAFAASVVESFRMYEMDASPGRYFEFVDSDVRSLWDAFDRGSGVIIVYFHYGNWELLTPAWSHLGMPRASAVARHVKNPLLTDFITATRTRDNVRILFRGRAGREVVRAVRNNEAVGIPCDINTTAEDGIFVDFFGKPAATTPAPARISLKYAAPVFITFLERKNDGGFLVRFSPVLDPGEYRGEADPAHAMMSAVNREIENVIRRDPGQYLWGHRRWNTRPPGDDWHPRY